MAGKRADKVDILKKNSRSLPFCAVGAKRQCKVLAIIDQENDILGQRTAIRLTSLVCVRFETKLAHSFAASCSVRITTCFLATCGTARALL